MAKGPINVIGGATVEAIIKAIRAAKSNGVSVPELARSLKLVQSTADNQIRRLVMLGLVECRHGTAEDMNGSAGRPPNRYTWAGKDFKFTTLEAFWDSQRAQPKAPKAKAKAPKAPKAKAKAPKAKAEPKATGRKALTAAQKEAKAAKDRARRAANKAPAAEPMETAAAA